MSKLRPFEFTTGRLSLDFVDTVSKRTASPIELLNSPEDLKRWVDLADTGLSVPVTVSELELGTARELREAIYRCILAVLEPSKMPGKDIELINETARTPDLRPQLRRGRVVHVSQDPIASLLAKIAADAVFCLETHNQDRIRRCPDCKIIFQDNSRANNRIWCSSSAKCGNRAKVRRHRASMKGKQP